MSRSKRPRTKGRKGICSVCAHPLRREIDVALVILVPLGVLVTRYDVSPDSLQRHKRNHLSPTQRAAIVSATLPSEIDLEALAKREGESLLAQLLAQRAILQSYSQAAFASGNITGAIQAERAVTDALTLTSKLLGAIVHRSEHSSTSVLISSDYLALRQTLIETLKPFPEASRAVGQALHALEVRAAQDITAKAARREPGAPGHPRSLVIEHRGNGDGHDDAREVEP